MSDAGNDRDLMWVKQSLRMEVCSNCKRRVAGDESVRAHDPLVCEPACDLFNYLPRLMDLVERFGHEPPCGYLAAVRNLPCKECSSPGCNEDACHETRPLDAYACDAMAIIELVIARKGQQ